MELRQSGPAFILPPRGVRVSAVISIVLVLVAAGGAAASIYQETLLDLWDASRRKAPVAWAEGKRLALSTYGEIRSRLPIDQPPKAEQVVAVAKPPRVVAVRQRPKGKR